MANRNGRYSIRVQTVVTSDTTIRVAEFPSRENSGKAIVIETRLLSGKTPMRKVIVYIIILQNLQPILLAT